MTGNLSEREPDDYPDVVRLIRCETCEALFDADEEGQIGGDRSVSGYADHCVQSLCEKCLERGT